MLSAALLVFLVAVADTLSTDCDCRIQKELRKAWICSNVSLTSIPDCVPDDTETLSIRTPSIPLTPDTIRRFKNVTRVNVNHFPNPRVSKVFISEKFNLTFFEIYDTHLEYVDPVWFLHNPHITTLVLSNNRIRYLSSDTFRFLPNLEELSINNNVLSSLPGNIFHGTSIKRVFMNTNFWHCGCDLATAMEYLWTQEVAFNEDNYCRYPEEIRGMDVKFLKRKDACLDCRDNTCTGETL